MFELPGVNLARIIFRPFLAFFIFKRVVPKGRYHMLGVITISLYVCVYVRILRQGGWGTQHSEIQPRPFSDHFKHGEVVLWCPTHMCVGCYVGQTVWQPSWISWQHNKAHNLLMLACSTFKLTW